MGHAFCKTKLRMHFDYEEGEFCKVEGYDCYGHYLKHYNFQTKFQSADLPLPAEITDEAKNWLAQHIKNTDFAYRGKLHLRRHYVVPDPYIWDESFAVGVQQMDDEHVGLFNIVGDVEADRNNQELWNSLQNLYNEHFRTEEALFTTIQDNKHDIADHRLRHLGLMNTVKGAQIPITEEMTEFIKNWLAQHIKNTDFSYRGLMPKTHPIPNPFKWNAFFAVYYPKWMPSIRSCSAASLRLSGAQLTKLFSPLALRATRTTLSRRLTFWLSLPPTPRRSCTSTSTSTTLSSWP